MIGIKVVTTLHKPSDDELDRLWKLVDHLGFDLEPSILIGGWATHLRVGGEVSTDIDLIINSPELRQRLRDLLEDYSENSHHSGGRKVRGEIDGVHIDAYIPRESNLGDKLRLDVHRLSKYVEPETVKGWLMLTLDAHIATKIAALIDRPETEKGEKDAREIVRLMREGSRPADGAKVVEVLLDTTSGPPDDILDYLQRMFELLPNKASLNKSDRRWLDGVRRVWLDEAERQLRRARVTT